MSSFSSVAKGLPDKSAKATRSSFGPVRSEGKCPFSILFPVSKSELLMSEWPVTRVIGVIAGTPPRAGVDAGCAHLRTQGGARDQWRIFRSNLGTRSAIRKLRWADG